MPGNIGSRGYCGFHLLDCALGICYSAEISTAEGARRFLELHCCLLQLTRDGGERPGGLRDSGVVKLLAQTLVDVCGDSLRVEIFQDRFGEMTDAGIELV